MERIVGYVFPIKEDHVIPIFDHKKSVFIKYSSRGGLLKHFKAGMKSIFYVSGKKYLVGEASIEGMERMTIEELLESYSNNLFLSEKELADYAKRSPVGQNRKTKIISVYKLKDIKKYAKPKFIKRKMTPTGYYMTEKEYLSL